jgi:hypothetical protein
MEHETDPIILYVWNCQRNCDLTLNYNTEFKNLKVEVRNTTLQQKRLFFLSELWAMLTQKTTVTDLKHEVYCISPSCNADACCTTVHLWQSWIWQ